MANRFRLVAIMLLWLMAPTVAPAMQQASTPPKFNIPWANGAVSPYLRVIPQASQIGVQNCAASLTDGFPPLSFIPASAGGCPPWGADFNGILKQITQWSRWSQASAPVFYDSTFSTQIGGYPKGTILQSSVLIGRLWFSTADDNTTDPDATTSANWTVLPGTTIAGTPVPSLSTVAPPNTVSANGLTVGNASSVASGRANADTYWLFVFLWTNCPNAQCPLYNSSGFAVARGGSANADFAANNSIATFNMNGAALMGADSQNGTVSSNLLNVPVTSGSRTVPGSVLGENLHTLTLAEIASHNHGGATGLTQPTATATNPSLGTNQKGVQSNGSVNGTAPQTTSVSVLSAADLAITVQNHSHTIPSAGGDGAHNTVPRSIVTYWNLAL